MWCGRSTRYKYKIQDISNINEVNPHIIKGGKPSGTWLVMQDFWDSHIVIGYSLIGIWL